MHPLLKVREISLVLGGKPVLKNVSFDLQRGEILTVLGPSGSGKSSLLRCLNRLVTIEGGEIFLDGSNFFQMKIVELRRRIGLVFQVPALLPQTVRENIRTGPWLGHRKLTATEIESLVMEVGLGREYLETQAETLSVGERQRVALAQVLANQPDILLLDEPTSALDPTAVQTVERLIRKLHREHDMGILMVTHNVAQAERFDAETLVLINGEVRAKGNIRRLKESTADETLKKFFEGRLETRSPVPDGGQENGK